MPRPVPGPDARFRQTARTWGRHAMPVIPDGAFVIYHATCRKRPDPKQLLRNGVPWMFLVATGTGHSPPCRSVCNTRLPAGHGLRVVLTGTGHLGGTGRDTGIPRRMVRRSDRPAGDVRIAPDDRPAAAKVRAGSRCPAGAGPVAANGQRPSPFCPQRARRIHILPRLVPRAEPLCSGHDRAAPARERR